MLGGSNEQGTPLREPNASALVAPGSGAPRRLGAVGLQGHVDAIESGRVYGWAWNPEAPGEHVSVDIHHKGALVGRTIANRFRQDLADLQMAGGTHAFVFDLPAEEREADSMAIAAYFSETGMPLSRGASDPLPQGDARRGSVESLAGRIDRMEASLQQVYRALHFFRTREETLPKSSISSDTLLLAPALTELKERHWQLSQQIDVLSREMNLNNSLVGRIDIDIQARASLSDVEHRIRAMTIRLAMCGGLTALALVGVTFIGLHLLKLI